MLLAYPGEMEGDVYVTPTGTDRIGRGAFRNARIKTLVLSPGVTGIDNNAFEGSSITTLVIPSSVTDIAVHSLFGADSIGTIFAEKGSVAEIFLRGEGRSDRVRIIPSFF